MSDLTGGQVFGRDGWLKAVGHNIIRVQAGRANLEVEACTVVYVLSIPIESYSILYAFVFN